jgi:hypothetical protein
MGPYALSTVVTKRVTGVRPHLVVPMVIVPAGSSAPVTAARASSARPVIRRAYGSRRSPASVRRMRLPSRSNRPTPSEDSRDRIRLVTLDWAYSSSAAAG